MTFQPDYRNIENAARNIQPKRLPLYEHLICYEAMTNILGKQFWTDDLDEYYKNYCEAFRKNGYDTVTYEACIVPILPDGGCLGLHKDPPAISDRADFERYPFDELPDIFFAHYSKHFEALKKSIPAGMKAIGGVGNGVFECVQDLTGYINLCFMSSDDPELYRDLFAKIGDISAKIWSKFMRLYGDSYCVLRFGDDLGYKSNTMLSKEDIDTHVIPQYRKIIDIVHSYGKPFLLHSCGNIFPVMDSLINDAKIDAKHSNEDQIAPFPVWVEKYGDKIGNFGGVDTDVLCRMDEKQIKEYTLDVIKKCEGNGGFALSSGNSIPHYVPFEGYMAMVETVREHRGDYKS